MKSIFISCLFLLHIILFAQIDPEAMKILDDVAEKMKSAESWEISFKYIYSNQQNNSNHEQSGSIKLKGDKYILDMLGNTVYYNGIKNYNYIKEANEVMILLPEDDTEELFFTQPSKLFTFYQEGFKSRNNEKVIINKKTLLSVDLFPNDLDKSFFKINILVIPDKNLIYSFKVFNKDGIQNEIVLTSMKEIKIEDSSFTFNPSKYPGVVIIDMTE